MNLQLNILFLFILFSYTANSADPPVYHLCYENNSTSTRTSRNIRNLLDILVSGTIQNGFIATSYGGEGGGGQETFYGLAQCRGDVGKADCSDCIRNASVEIQELCPSQTAAKIWYDFCFLRYSTDKFFGQVDTSGLYLYNVENVTDPDDFNKKLGQLFREISSEAVQPANKGLGKRQTEISPFLTLYGLVQCTRDLSMLNCEQCLAIAIGNFPGICRNKKGCRVLYGSCYVRYELYPFYFGS